jgi:hypothetical protein
LNSSNITNPNNQTNETNISESFYAISKITSLSYSNVSYDFSFNLLEYSKKINQSGEFLIPSNLTIRISGTDGILSNLNYILDKTQNQFGFSYIFSSSGTIQFTLLFAL